MSDFDRPAYACVTCRPPKTDAWVPAEHGWLICDHCYNRLIEMLAEISQRYLQLNPRPGSGGLSGGRGAPGFGSRSPASDHIIAMRDSRSGTNAHVWVGGDGRVHREDSDPVRSVVNVLLTHAVDVCELRGFAGHNCTSVHELTSWLTSHLDWIARQSMIVEFSGDLSVLVRQLRPVTGERRVWIGDCEHCDSRLYASTIANVTCDECGHVWETRSDLLKLRAKLAAARDDISA